MRKTHLTGFVLAVGIAACGQREPTAEAPEGRTSGAAHAEAEPSAFRGSSVTARPDSVAADKVGSSPKADELTPEEQHMLDMYEELAVMLGDDKASCETMASGLSLAIQKRSEEIHAWRRRQTARTSFREEDEERLRRVAGERMKLAQATMQKAMGKCMQVPPFQASLAQLAEMSGS